MRHFLILVVAAVLLSATGASAAGYGGGTGTPEDPYQILDANNLNEIGLHEEDWDKCFVLMDDIDMEDLSGVEYNTIGWYVSTHENHPFDGVFDGRGHIVRNLCYSAAEGHCVGMFAYLRGEVKHLGLENVNIDVPGGSDVGGLVGHTSAAKITCCFVKGYIRGDSCVGGIVGYNEVSRLTSCYSEATVSGRFAAGGLVGYGRRCQWIYDCYSIGDLTRGGGGFIGFSDDENCMYIENCFWDIERSRTTYDAGGALGLATSQMQDPGTFATAGWDLTISLEEPWHMWGKQSEGEYPRLWFENPDNYPLPQFSGGNGTGSNPYLIANTSDLNSIAHDPRLMDKAFCLIDDIVLDEVALNAIGQQLPFEGSFDGMWHVVRNIGNFVDSDRHVGLFGEIGSLGRVCNVILEDVHIDTVNASCVGGLAGVCYGKISNCSSEGSVRGLRLVGGLVGSADGVVLRSFATGNVSGRFTVGGFCGGNYGAIEDCYSQSSVEGDTLVGGLVGHTSNGTFSYCYATGNTNGLESIGGLVGENSGANISSCFWDIDASGIGESAGGIGKTAGEMKQRSSFADWDFVGEDVNGVADVWRMCLDDVDYPRLSWEFSQGGDFDCRDGVGIEDMVYLAGRWLMEGEFAGAADANGDGVVGLADFGVMGEAWGGD